jgi:hypothetical protein
MEVHVMGLLFALLLIVAGVLAAASLIVAKQPNAREVIAKLTPYQGIIGIILLIWALIVFIFRVLPVLGYVMQGDTLGGLLVLLTFLVAIVLGFLLGYGLIKQYALSKSAEASRGGDAMQLKLAKFQGPLGIIGIGLGLWMLISALRWGMF